MRMWPTTAFSPSRNEVWWRLHVGPTRGVISIRRWIPIRRAWAPVLAYIAHLYTVEKRARRSGIVGQDLRLLREHASKPVLETLCEYLEKIREEVLPKSEAGQAIAYPLKNWTALTPLPGQLPSADRQQPHRA